MDELDIFAAIGGVDEKLLTEAPRRLPRRWGLIAAVLALAVLTACAAPVVIRSFTAVSGGVAEQTGKYYEQRIAVINQETGVVVSFSTSREMRPAEYLITLEMEGDCKRPKSLEEWYALTWVPEDYVNHFDNSEENCRILRFATEDRGNVRGSYIELRQSLLPEGNPVTFTESFANWGTLFVNDMVSEYISYGDAAVLELACEMDPEDVRIFSGSFQQISRYLYWSDGAYLFRLEVPYLMDADTIGKIIGSVQVAEE